jgi:hypothetical protein
VMGCGKEQVGCVGWGVGGGADWTIGARMLCDRRRSDKMGDYR